MRGRVLVLAGGGGHTGYAYAIAQALEGKVSLSFLAPEGDSLSERRLRRLGRVNFLVKPRGPKTPTYKFVVRLAKSFTKSMWQVSRKFDVVVSSGSNFCVPPAITAWTKGIPVVNVESPVRFSKASQSARMLQPFSRITALHWKEQKRLLDGVVVGPLLPKPEFKPWNGGYILVTGGTYGHKLLFDTLMESDLHDVVLQTGRVDPGPYAIKHPEWKLITVTEKFHKLLAGADLVVMHFGSTVLDAAAYGKPIVLVPNPEWTRTAGMEDAEHLAEKVNAVLVSKISLENLLEAIDRVKKRKVPLFPNGAKNLAKIIIELL